MFPANILKSHWAQNVFSVWLWTLGAPDVLPVAELQFQNLSLMRFWTQFYKSVETSQNQVYCFIHMEGICFSFWCIAGNFHSLDLEHVWTSVSCSSSPFVPSLPSALWRPDCCFPLPGCFIYICSPSTSHLLSVSHRCAADTSSGRPGSTICCFMSLSPLFSSSFCGYRTTRGTLQTYVAHLKASECGSNCCS